MPDLVGMLLLDSSLKKLWLIIYMEENYKTTCVPHHFLYSLSEKRCTISQATQLSDLISLFSPFFFSVRFFFFFFYLIIWQWEGGLFNLREPQPLALPDHLHLLIQSGRVTVAVAVALLEHVAALIYTCMSVPGDFWTIPSQNPSVSKCNR